MSDDAKAVIVSLGIVLSFLMGLGTLMVYVKERQCYEKWTRAGMDDVSWGFFKGCMLKLPDGRWLPAERVREIELPRKK